MKKLLLSICAFSITIAATSQIELTLPGSTTLINGTNVTYIDTLENDMNQDVEMKIDVKSLYTSTKNIRVKKIELTADATAQVSENAICWGLCTIGVVWGTQPIVLSDPLPMNTNQTIQYSGHVYPKLGHGKTTFRYVWFDMNNTNDSTWVDVTYEVRNVNMISINEIKKETELKLFPNPASTLLNVHLNSNEDNKRVEIIDLLGKKVFSQQVNSNVFKTQINTSTLNPGVYFVSVLANNKAVRTEKVIITN